MGDNILGSVTGIVTAIIGVAIIAVLVSQRANTANVITALGNALSSDLKAATGPVTGGF